MIKNLAALGAILFLIPTLVLAQEPVSTETREDLLVQTVGILDQDGSALYSVLVASGDTLLGEVTITSKLPEGATFVEAFWTPEDATFVGEQAGQVIWTLPVLPDNTIVGPFTYRVRFEEETDLPPTVEATATIGNLSAKAPLLGQQRALADRTVLERPADSGSLTVLPEGTNGFVEVGDTEIWLSVPAGALEEPATLTFTRLPPDDSGLPQELSWWCTVVRIETDPQVTWLEPVTLLLPARRTLTPFLEVLLFRQDDAGEWQDIRASAVVDSDDLQEVYVNGSGEYVVVRDTMLLNTLEDGAMVLAAGVDIEARRQATTSSTTGFDDPNLPLFDAAPTEP